MDLDTNPNDLSIKGLGIHMSGKELLTVKLVGERTKEIGQVAYDYAFEGRLAPLTALLIVAADKVNDSVVERPDFRSGFKEKATIYKWLIREALDLGVGSEKSERRKLLLREIELLQLFGAVAHSGGGEKKGKKKKKKVISSPLIRAAQVGDEAIVQLLLKTNTDVNDADANGDTALHWTLKLSRFFPQHIRILWLLLEHGALVHQRNKLGLTAFDIAAGNGNSEALEVLLLGDLDGKHYITGMKETPLSVKNRSEECAELLLTWGANSEVPQQCRQRAIDLATSQAMCNILLSPSTVNLNSSSNKAEVYKYFDSHRKCVRGAKCFFMQIVWRSLRK